MPRKVQYMPSAESSENRRSTNRRRALAVSVSLAALTSGFLTLNLELNLLLKSSIFISIVFGYLWCLSIYFFRKKQTIKIEPEVPAAVLNQEVEAKLFALEEARQFFGASLKYADMFRLVANRLNEIVPFATCVLFIVGESRKTLQSKFAVGENTSEFADLKVRIGSGLAGKALRSGAAQIDEQLSEDRKIIFAKALKGLQTGIAAPLFQNAEVFGVLVLYGGAENRFDEKSLKLLEAAAERVAPLFLSSQTFENNLSNALTDALTALPNERAFYLVLENQIAEAQRFRGERPLTILTMDVVNFDEVNQKYGHATGDRALGFAAETIKAQLRQMDLLARSTGDEFLAVLPTASETVAQEIVERVRKRFVLNPFKISPTETVHLHLNFGASSFGRDGETAATLVKHALLKKRQAKNDDGANKILFFPKEFVN